MDYIFLFRYIRSVTTDFEENIFDGTLQRTLSPTQLKDVFLQLLVDLEKISHLTAQAYSHQKWRHKIK